ncbi:MAG TPA: FHA domain-containing protein [Kofleriaceae bacterium]|nr:FHA domain-containing protein [Kofleriaceae bacterium]
MIQDDEGKTTVVPLIRDEITIGRKEGNTIRLTERNVSRRHARILRNNGEVHIEDLNSYNGIRVNNARIAERVSLRVSDQVQIGDYKLYLKAEGEQQADDPMASPLDRVDPVMTPAMNPVMPQAVAGPVGPVGPAGPPPDVMPSGTAPVAALPSAPQQIINAPNRPMVPLDEPAGRSIGPATQEAIDAIKRPAGYGKLVVLSSNFAGREFELSRPQMIIGRTDENDIVINHRSISRNHAKLVREPETGRYTISDLQSSNGVRVNGQDYGKVELRRGDVVDLGHVRLRFVEAGEDFLFARDAVITDVPETGGKRGMVMAIIAAILVVAAGIVVYSMRSTGPDKPKEGSNIATPGSGSELASIDATTDEVATNPGHPTPEPDAAVAAHPPDDEVGRKLAGCVELNARRKWQDLLDCANGLLATTAKDKATALKTTAVRETLNEQADGRIRQDLKNGSLKEAQAELKKMGAESVYFHDLNELFDKFDLPNQEEARHKISGYLAGHDCTALHRFATQQQTGATGTERVLALVREAQAKCTEKTPGDVAVVRPNPGRGSNAGGNTGSATTAPSPNKVCDTMNVEDMMTQAANQYNSGYASAALLVVTKALACKQDVRMYRLAATYACAAHDASSAKAYFNKVPTQYQGSIQQKCQLEKTPLDVNQ